MAMKFLARSTRMPLPIALVLSAVVLCGWIPAFMAQDWRLVLPTMLLAVVNAFVFQGFAMQVGLVSMRERDGLPIFIYLLSATACTQYAACWQGQVAVLGGLIVLYGLQRCFREEEPTETAFLSSLLLCLCSLVLPDMVWLIAVLWVAFMILHSFGLRVWLATLIGASVFAIYFLIALYFGWIDNVYGALFVRRWLFGGEMWWHEIAAAVMIVLGIAYGIGAMLRVDRDSANQQNSLLLFVLLFVVCAGLSLVPMCKSAFAICHSMMPMLCLVYAGLAVLYFRQEESIARGVWYWLSIVLLVGCYVVNLIL